MGGDKWGARTHRLTVPFDGQQALTSFMFVSTHAHYDLNA